MSDIASATAAARARFMELVAEVRPEMHRYCARMTGSVFDGEDVVQDALAKAWYALAEMESPPPLRPWLFRIAHNTAMDFLRRYEYRNIDPDTDPDTAAHLVASREHTGHEPDGALVELALKLFAALPPVQRSALALKDVLGLSLEEAAATMGVSVGAVKGALVRARANVAAAAATTSPLPTVNDHARLQRYALLFNARDWTGLRALFGEETRLDLVSRYKRRGPEAANYVAQYVRIAPVEALRAVAGWVDGSPAIAVFRSASAVDPAYFVLLEWRGEEVVGVRDFYYVPYIAADAAFSETAPPAL
jgi:RNA polymerase sigma-70 factor (ECF subfamily)